MVASAHSRGVGVARDNGYVGRRFHHRDLGADAKFNSNDGNSSTIPVAVFVTVFAFLGTWIVARYSFGQQRKD